MNEDYRDLLAALIDRETRFLVVGAHALAAHGYPRATVDIDIWIDATAENARRIWLALADFGAPLDDLSIREADLMRPNVVAQLGLPPNRIDILTGRVGSHVRGSMAKSCGRGARGCPRSSHQPCRSREEQGGNRSR